MTKPVLFVIFGGTGDLMKRKLAPAMAKLMRSGILSKDSAIIATSRKEMNDEKYKEFISYGVDDLEDLLKFKIMYAPGDASEKGSLNLLINKIKEFNNHDKIFYLATSYSLFPSIMRLIKAENLEKDSKIIFEKPFGHDLGSSDALNDEITKIFPEDKIYRIDHYLAKETVLNLATLKFSNPLINSLMNRVFVEKINVVADEDFGVGDRIEYYNGAGAIKDMIQSHLLQILALLLIDRPERLDPDEIHRKKFDVLTRIRPAINKKNTIGQYKSYSSELLAKGIQGSRTDTFAEICLDCDNDIWRGVPLWIRTGKKLKNKLGQIVVEFKTSSDFPSNELVIDIYPKQDIALVLNSRVPGSKDVKPVRLEFNREKEFGPNSPDEYSVLLQEMIRGEKLLFPRYGEIRESWRIVEDIEALKKEMKFIVYDDGSEPLNLKKNL